MPLRVTGSKKVLLRYARYASESLVVRRFCSDIRYASESLVVRRFCSDMPQSHW